MGKVEWVPVGPGGYMGPQSDRNRTSVVPVSEEAVPTEILAGQYVLPADHIAIVDVATKEMPKEEQARAFHNIPCEGYDLLDQWGDCP